MTEAWNIVKVPKGMTPKKAYELCGKEFNCYTYRDLGAETITEDRNADESYTIEFKPNIESDEDLKNVSARELATRNISCITLTERLLLELQYFKATGKHLDVDTITLCAGSRDSGGGVPRCYWFPDSRGFDVDWCFVGGSGDGLRARQVVSCSLGLKPSNLTPSVAPQFTVEEVSKLKRLAKLLES